MIAAAPRKNAKGERPCARGGSARARGVRLRAWSEEVLDGIAGDAVTTLRMLRHGIEVLPMHRLVGREVGDPPGPQRSRREAR